MINFDEQTIIRNYAYIYDKRREIETIADDLCAKGLDLLFFTSSGGSMAMMQPFTVYCSQLYHPLECSSDAPGVFDPEAEAE